MQAKATLSAFGKPVPELPVRDVERAQAHRGALVNAPDIESTYRQMRSRQSLLLPPGLT